MDAEILKWLVKNKIRIKLSIDGEQAVHDKNRIYIDGKGSYEKIIFNFPLCWMMRFQKNGRQRYRLV